MIVCECCYLRPAEHKHHMLSQTKANVKLYPDYIHHEMNILRLCSICHLNKSIPKLTELEFCRLLKIKPRSKELLQKINDGKIEKFW